MEIFWQRRENLFYVEMVATIITKLKVIIMRAALVEYKSRNI